MVSWATGLLLILALFSPPPSFPLALLAAADPSLHPAFLVGLRATSSRCVPVGDTCRALDGVRGLVGMPRVSLVFFLGQATSMGLLQ